MSERAPKEQRVALYSRVSTEGQDPASQTPRLRAWADHKGFQVALERSETASSRLVRRPMREEIMQEARGHHIHAVAVTKLDRWGRSLVDIKTSLDELTRLGVHFYAIDQGIAIQGRQDPAGAFLLSILGAAAELERDLISERTKQSMAYVRDVLGKHVGRPRKGALPKSPGTSPVSPVAPSIPLSD